MSKLEKFLGHYTINPFKNNSFIKVYFYEKGISFEENITKEIIENEKVSEIFLSINKDWKNAKKEKSEIILDVMKMISENESFFKEIIPHNPEIDYNEFYYDLLKIKKILINIEQKEFEQNILRQDIGNYYTENLEKINSSDTCFYKYKTEEGKLFFIMVIDNKIKLGFGR